MSDKAWQLGAPGTPVYSLYDGMRRGLNRKLVGYLLARAVSQGCSKVLEAGSGPAFASSILASDARVDLAVAVDIDIEALQVARRRDTNLALAVADLQVLPFRSESLDLTWNSSTIEHLEDPAAALVEMERVTKTGGKVFVGVPNLYGPLGFQRWIDATSVGHWIGTVFGLSRLKAMLRAVGLHPQHSIHYFFRFFVGVLSEK